MTAIRNALIRKKSPSISPSDSSLGIGIIFDAILQEIDTRESQIASYATEMSYYGNDHTVHKNPILQIRVAVSDNPVKVAAAQASSYALSAQNKYLSLTSSVLGYAASSASGLIMGRLGGAAASAVGIAAEAAISSFAMSNRRSVDVFNSLEKMRLSSQLVNFVGTKRDYTNYRITKIREVVEKEVEAAGIYDITLEKPRTFSTVASSVEINSRIRNGDDSSNRSQSLMQVGQVGVSNE